MQEAVTVFLRVMSSVVVVPMAVENVREESVLSSSVLDGPDVTAWFLHRVLADDFLACVESIIYA